MVALFLAVSTAVALVLWAELGPAVSTRQRARATPAPLPELAPLAPRARHAAPSAAGNSPAAAATADEDAAVIARLSRLLAEPVPPAPPRAGAAAKPAPVPLPEPAAGDLLRIAGFRPGDVIELELEGPAPRPEDIRFEQIGRDTRVLIDGFPALIVARAPARMLSPAAFRFRSPRAA